MGGDLMAEVEKELLLLAQQIEASRRFREQWEKKNGVSLYVAAGGQAGDIAEFDRFIDATASALPAGADGAQPAPPAPAVEATRSRAPSAASATPAAEAQRSRAPSTASAAAADAPRSRAESISSAAPAEGRRSRAASSAGQPAPAAAAVEEPQPQPIQPPQEPPAAEAPAPVPPAADASPPVSGSPKKVAKVRASAGAPRAARGPRGQADAGTAAARSASEEEASSPAAVSPSPQTQSPASPTGSPEGSPRRSAAEQRRARSEEQQRLKQQAEEQAAAREKASAEVPELFAGWLQCLGKKGWRQSWSRKYCVADSSQLAWYSSEPKDKANPGKADGAVPWVQHVQNSRGSTYPRKSTLCPVATKDHHPKVGKEPPYHFGVNYWETSGQGQFDMLCLAAESPQQREEWVKYMGNFCDIRQ